MYSWYRIWIYSLCVYVFRCRGVSRRSWTVRWGGTVPPSSVTEEACPTWRPPSGRCYGSALWLLCLSPMWPSLTPGTLNTAMTLIQGHSLSSIPDWMETAQLINTTNTAPLILYWQTGLILEDYCSCNHPFLSLCFSVASGISQWGKELESSSTCGLCTMMRRSGKPPSSFNLVRGNFCPMCHILSWQMMNSCVINGANRPFSHACWEKRPIVAFDR